MFSRVFLPGYVRLSGPKSIVTFGTRLNKVALFRPEIGSFKFLARAELLGGPFSDHLSQLKNVTAVGGL